MNELIKSQLNNWKIGKDKDSTQSRILRNLLNRKIWRKSGKAEDLNFLQDVKLNKSKNN